MKYFKGLLSLGIRLIYGITVNLIAVKLFLINLSEEYYGVYSLIIGGSILFFSFLQASNATAQRFFSFNRSNTKILAYQLNLLISYILKIGMICCFLGISTISAYFIFWSNYPVLEILAPVILLSFFSFFQVLGIPFNALLSSLEKFKLYSFAVGFDNTIKLLAAISAYFPVNSYSKLFLCCVVLLLGSIFSFFLKIFFAKKVNIYFKFSFNIFSSIPKDLNNFTLFSSFGLISKNVHEHANNYLLDVFFNTILVSFRTVANQLFNLIFQFSGTLFLAFKSDIIHNYSKSEIEFTNKLILNSSKLLLLSGVTIIFPVYSNMDFLIDFWLGKNNSELILFSKLALVAALVLSLHYPLTALIHATGKIKKFSIVTESIVILTFVITLVLYYLKQDASVIFYTSIFCFFIAHLFRIHFCNQIKGFKGGDYLKKFFYPSLILIFILFSIFPFIEELIIKIESIYLKILIHFLTSLLMFIIVFPKDSLQLYRFLSKSILKRNIKTN